MVKGAERLLLYSDICKTTKLVMTFPLLKLLGNEIAQSNWSVDSKRTFWTACCVAFFGSFRLGEILSSRESEYGHETLSWDDVQIFEDHAVLHIQAPKSIRSSKGDFVDIFPAPTCCPFEALKGLKSAKSSFVSKNMPVFAFDNGRYLTASSLTATLRILLQKHVGNNVHYLSGHSFRAGIPAALSDCPDLASDDDIRKWGRWNSDTYRLYTRLKLNARRAIFVKIISAINSRHA